MDNIGEIGTMRHRKVYDAILKNTKKSYMHQNISMDFSYDTNKEYDDHALNITKMEGFDDIKAENELQTFINATNWVTHILWSDKQPRIESISGHEIISNVQKGLYAANCYAHAVVLNDVFHLLGYKGKYIFCEPIDYHFTDNHVVNLVFSEKAHKWMLFDSAQGVYFTKKDGEVMSLRDLREFIIEDEPFDVILLEGVWSDLPHKKLQVVKNKIITYMTKNLYRFASFSNPYIDRTIKQGSITYYELVPSSYMETPLRQADYDHNAGIRQITMYCSDETEFWKTPEV